MGRLVSCLVARAHGRLAREHHLIFESTLAAARGRDRATVIERLELALSSVTRGEERDGEDARAYSRSELVIHWVWCEARDAARVRRRAHADDAARDAPSSSRRRSRCFRRPPRARWRRARARPRPPSSSLIARDSTRRCRACAPSATCHADAERAGSRGASGRRGPGRARCGGRRALRPGEAAIEAYHEKVRRARRRRPSRAARSRRSPALRLSRVF